MSIFLRRCTLHLVNPSAVPTFIKRVQKGFEPSAVAYSQTQTQTLGQTFSMFVGSTGAGSSEPEGRAQHAAHSAQLWLTHISKHCPALYKAHIGEFSKAIADERNARLVEACLHALAAAAAWDEKLAPTDKCVLCGVLVSLCGKGVDPWFSGGQTYGRAGDAVRYGITPATCEVRGAVDRVHAECGGAVRAGRRREFAALISLS